METEPTGYLGAAPLRNEHGGGYFNSGSIVPAKELSGYPEEKNNFMFFCISNQGVN